MKMATQINTLLFCLMKPEGRKKTKTEQHKCCAKASLKPDFISLGVTPNL